ncbi:MAG TPA: M15 family metallopeptidase [Bryobacteraceae bacterium]|nr:M15 family metallopeptidase [Bryobacteraceae bacterium]
MKRSILFCISSLLMAAACAAQPPEIVTHKTAAFTGRIERISGPLLAKMRATTWHEGCPVSPDDLRQLTLSYWNFDQMPMTGVLVVDRDVAQEVVGIFRELFQHGFLIEKMTPVEDYQGSDDASMAANNTSAFNCRDVTGQPGKFSNHSWGRAIDINPLTNPYVKGDKVLPPAGRQYLDRTKAFPGSILADSFIVKLFGEKGWTWGGSWGDRKDYQHFEKPAAH